MSFKIASSICLFLVLLAPLSQGASNGRCNFNLECNGKSLSRLLEKSVCLKASGEKCCQEMIEKCIPAGLDFARKATRPDNIILDTVCGILPGYNDSISLAIEGGSTDCHGGKLQVVVRLSDKKLCCNGEKFDPTCKWVVSS